LQTGDRRQIGGGRPGDRTIMRARIKRRKSRHWLLAVMVLACGLATTASARAEVRVEGDPAALRLTSSGDALSEILSAFGASFSIRYRSSVPLNEVISGTYTGSLSQVVSRLLQDYNYVIKQDQGLSEIIVFGRKGTAALPPKPSLSKGALSRWR
jgi:hypothetical protein